MNTMMKRLQPIIREAKNLARRYREATGRQLGITGEVAEFEACRLLNLTLAPVQQSGYDATRSRGRKLQKVQIKGRCMLSKNPRQRVGRIQLAKEWDSVALVLLDEHYEPLAIYGASRPAVTDALNRPGSRARNERGALAVSKFKSISREVWARK